MIFPKQKKERGFIFGASLIIALLLLFGTRAAQADDCKVACDEKCAIYTDPNQNQSCRDQCKVDEQTCEQLSSKQAAVQKLIKVNSQTQNLLSNQLDYINQQQADTQDGLKTVQTNLTSLDSQIESLKADIADKESQLVYQRKILENLMQSYYDYDQQGILGLVLWNKNSLMFGQGDYIEQSGLKVSDVLSEIKSAQAELISNNQKLQDDYQKNSDLNDQLTQKKSDLQSSENQKQWLLQKTQGEEQQYEQMLAKIEEEKAQLFDFSSASNIGDVLNSVKSYPQPDKKYWASTSWYFSQTDSRWGSQRIGNSHSLMKDYGCAVTSVAMVFKNLGASIDPGRMAKAKVFYGDLINWPDSWDPGIELASSVSHGNVSWSKIDSEISDDHPVIVHIQKTSGGGGHYVVITGKDSHDYIVHDPYFGANIYLGTSRSLIGKLGTNSGTRIDQMIIYD